MMFPGLILAAAGVAIIAMSESAARGRLKRNGIAGIRLPSVMASDEAWRCGHRAARHPMVAAGLSFVCAGLGSAFVRSAGLANALVGCGALAGLAGVVVAAVLAV